MFRFSYNMQFKQILTVTNFSPIEATNPSYFIHTKRWKLIKSESKTQADSQHQISQIEIKISCSSL